MNVDGEGRSTAVRDRSGPRIRHILFVCTGNLCRSPMAEGIFRRFLKKNNVEGVEVSSAGLFTYDGGEAEAFAVQAASERGIDLSPHRSRTLTLSLAEKAELILAMELDQVQDILSMCIGKEEKVGLLGSCSKRRRGLVEVKDPFGGTIEDHRACFEHLRELLEDLFISLARGSEKGYIEVPVKRCVSNGKKRKQ